MMMKNTALVLFKSLFLTSLISIFSVSKAQVVEIDPAPFQDGIHHWYDIKDKENVVNPSANQPRYKPTQVKEVADNILLYQKDNGGWPKNYDIFAILTPTQIDSVSHSKSKINTTYDNGTTYTHIAALAKAYSATHSLKYKFGAIKGLNFIIASQYENGGWPQYFPLQKNYSRHITYNDGAMIGIMELLKKIHDGNGDYSFLNKKLKKKLDAAYAKGIDCIVKTQISDKGTPTAWCQQYDEITLQPAWARAFEPPSICNLESSDILLFLMSIDHPNKPIVNAVENAVRWFEDSKILNTRVKVVQADDMNTPFRLSKTDRVIVNDPSAPPIWTRYYELNTHRPLFCNRDSKVVYSLAEVERERRDGYAWYTYAPAGVIEQFTKWQKRNGITNK